MFLFEVTYVLNVAYMQKIKIAHRAKFSAHTILHCIATSGVLRVQLLIDINININVYQKLHLMNNKFCYS